MRKSIVLLFLLWSFFGYSQNDLYCLHDTAGFYRLATINTATGVITNKGALSGISFYVLGNKDCTSTHDSTYIFCGHDGNDARLYTLSLNTGSILSSPIFNDNVVGLRYNCNDSTIYAVEEITGAYWLVTVDKTTGLTTQRGVLGGVSAYAGDGFALDTKRGLYYLLGLQAPNIYIYSVDITTGTVISSFPFPDNVIGLNYNCNDSTVYGLWEDGLDYKLERVIPSTGNHSTVGVLNNIVPGFVAESASINRNGEYTYRGFSSTNVPVLVTIDVQTANIIDTVGFTNTIAGIDHYFCCTSNPVNVTENINQNEILVYPNPFTDQVNVNWRENILNGTIRLYDVSGKLIYSEHGISGNSYSLSGEKFEPGVYFVYIKTENKLLWKGKLISD